MNILINVDNITVLQRSTLRYLSVGLEDSIGMRYEGEAGPLIKTRVMIKDLLRLIDIVSLA